jgi:hypothetical protein
MENALVGRTHLLSLSGIRTYDITVEVTHCRAHIREHDRREQ